MRKSPTIVAIAVLLTALGGCDRFSEALKKAREQKSAEGEQPPKPPEIVFPVEVTPPVRRDMHAFLTNSARIEAERQVDVVSEGIGQCLLITVEEGDTVTAGQILAELDKADLEAQVRQSQVSVRQQQVTLERTKQLEGVSASAMELDNARFALEQAQATLESLEVRLGNQTIRAPIGGVVTRRNVQKGMLVSTGAPAFTIVDPSSYVLPIYVWEGALHRVAIGQEAIVAVDSVPDEEFRAVVRRINPGVEQGGKVKVLLDFDDATRQRLRDGLYARVHLITDLREDALAVTKDAIVEENARTYLMVAVEAPPEEAPEEETALPPESVEATDTEEGGVVHAQAGDAEKADAAAEDAEPKGPGLVAERVEVELGLEDAEYIEIVSGIEEGARVITLGQHTVKPGARVRVTSVAAELTANAGMSAKEALKAAQEEADLKEKSSGQPNAGKDGR